MERRGLVAAVGMLIVHGALSAQPPLVQFKATEQWRVDGSESGEPFGGLRDFVVLRDGSMWVLDFKDQYIRRYDASGTFLGVTGRKGSGPGEMSNANGLAASPDNTVWVNDPDNARINIYTADGKFQRQITRSPGGYAYRWGAWFDKSNGELYEQTIGGPPRWRRVGGKGDTANSVAFTSCHDRQPSPGFIRGETKGHGSTNMGYPFSSGGGMVAVGDKSLWCAAPRASRVARVRVGTNDTLARTTVEIPLIVVDNAERDAAIAGIEKSLSRYAVNNFDKSKVPKSKPGIAGVHVDGDRRLWVQHAAKIGVRTTTFDVHDATGLRVARLTIPARAVWYMPLQSNGDRVWLVVLDDDDVQSIVQYKLSR